MLLSASRDLYVRSAGVSSRSAASAIDLNDSVGAPIEFRQARADDALIGKSGTGLPHARSLGSGKLPIFVHIVALSESRVNHSRLRLDTMCPMLPGLLELRDFATRYTAAWCSQHPESVAAFFSQDGSLRVNDDPPAVGRNAVAEVAQSFMTAFPDLSVVMDDLLLQGDQAEYHWTLTGTNTGPGGSGRRVRISGFEKWRIGCDGLIASSQGHFDAAEYRRQLSGPKTSA